MAQKRTKGRRGVSAAQVWEVVQSMRAAEQSRTADVKVEVLVGARSPREQVEVVKDAFVPQTTHASVLVWDVASRASEAPDADCDLMVVVQGVDATATSEVARRCARQGVPVTVVATTSLDAPDDDGSGLVTVVATDDPEDLRHRLAACVAQTPQRISFAANFPFCRDEVVRALVSASALGCAGIGAVSLIPGSDFPLMTAAQVELALQIAAASGEAVSVERAPEIAGVVAAGLAYRAVARAAAGAVPALGWALKVAVGYGGTVLTGRALQARFDHADHGRGEVPAPEREHMVIVPVRASLDVPQTQDSDGYILL